MKYLDKELLVKALKEDGRCRELLIDIESNKYDVKDYETLAISFVGKRINDSFCNGYFGSGTYDLNGAEITRIDQLDGKEITIVVTKKDGKYDYGYFNSGQHSWQFVYEYLDRWVNRKNT